jgi:HEAT repeats
MPDPGDSPARPAERDAAARDDMMVRSWPRRVGRRPQLLLVALVGAVLLPAVAAPTAAAQDQSTAPASAPAPTSTQGQGQPTAPDPATGLSAPSASDGKTPVDPRTRAGRRLLHLRQGGVLRGQTRLVGDHWEYQRAGQWEALPAGAVTEDKPESVVVAEAATRRAALRHGDITALAAHASWLAGAGLYAESLKVCSEVLDADADQPAVLALLRSGDLPVVLPSLGTSDAGQPATHDALLAYASAAPRAVQELAVEKLRAASSEGPALQALRVELDGLLTDKSAPMRSFALLALRRLLLADAMAQPEVEQCLHSALQDGMSDVRKEASLALRDLHEEGIILPALKALEVESPVVRIHAAESLGYMGYTAAVPALVQRLLTLPVQGGSGGFHAPHANIFVGKQIAYISGFHVNVAQNAAIGTPDVGVLQEGATLDAAVLGSSGSDVYLAESKALRTALTRLTNANPGSSKSEWKSWWLKNQDRWPGALATPSLDAPPSTTGGATQPAGKTPPPPASAPH